MSESMPSCPSCQSVSVVKGGSTRHGKQIHTAITDQTNHKKFFESVSKQHSQKILIRV